MFTPKSISGIDVKRLLKRSRCASILGLRARAISPEDILSRDLKGFLIRSLERIPLTVNNPPKVRKSLKRLIEKMLWGAGNVQEDGI